MKKILSAVLCLVLLIGAAPVSRAATCSHSYTSRTVYKSCISRTKTVYTCDKCGTSYFSSSLVYEKPEGFCDEAWKAIYAYAFALTSGGTVFGQSRCITCCNDGARPVVFMLEAVE